MAHINPIKSRPLSDEGRENYDRIFRRFGSPSWLPTPAELEESFEDKQREDARELHHELRQKYLDQSA